MSPFQYLAVLIVPESLRDAAIAFAQAVDPGMASGWNRGLVFVNGAFEKRSSGSPSNPITKTPTHYMSQVRISAQVVKKLGQSLHQFQGAQVQITPAGPLASADYVESCGITNSEFTIRS